MAIARITKKQKAGINLERVRGCLAELDADLADDAVKVTACLDANTVAVREELRSTVASMRSFSRDCHEALDGLVRPRQAFGGNLYWPGCTGATSLAHTSPIVGWKSRLEVPLSNLQRQPLLEFGLCETS
jgi:hypothetical protein